MKLSPVRWALACLLGCALIAVTMLPAGYLDESSGLTGWWRPPSRVREANMEQRARIVFAHARLLHRNYRAELDIENANRLFGTRNDSAGDPIVWFAPDIPESVRRQESAFIADERAARGEWRGHGAVGVMVITDTATTIDGLELFAIYAGERSPTSMVLPATPANGNHCVAVIRLRTRALHGYPYLNTNRLPLDGCAFTDAFGAPGPKIAEWLRFVRYSYGRRLSLEQPTKKPETFSFWDQGSIRATQCRGGDDSACVVATSGIDTRDESWAGFRNDLSVRALDVSQEMFGEIGGFEETFLEAMVRDLGPARFQRMWRSQKTLPEAYFDETGEPFAGWVRGRLVQFYGPYHKGPLPTPESALLTIAAIVAMAVIGVRFAPRPYAA